MSIFSSFLPFIKKFLMDLKVIFGDNSHNLLQFIQLQLLQTIQEQDDQYCIVFVWKEDFLEIVKKIDFSIFEDKFSQCTQINYKVIDEFEQLIQYLSKLKLLSPGPVSIVFFNFEKYFLPEKIKNDSLRESYDIETRPPILSSICMLC